MWLWAAAARGIYPVKVLKVLKVLKMMNFLGYRKTRFFSAEHNRLDGAQVVGTW